MQHQHTNNLKLFLIVFTILNLVFAFYQINFFIGNHDWDWVKGTNQVLSLTTGMFEARYAKFILNVFLYSGQILPIINNITAFALLSYGLVLLTNYWKIKTLTNQIIIAIIPAITPYILGWLYFPINIIGNFQAVILGLGGLILIEKNTKTSKLFSLICFLIAYGVYPSVIEMIIICFLIEQILQPKNTKKELVTSASYIILSLIIFKILLYILSHYNLIISNYYNLETKSFIDIIKDIPKNLTIIISQLYISIPFVTTKIKLLGLTLIILATLATTKKHQSTLLMLIAIITTGLTSIISTQTEISAYMPRINFYGISFLYAGSTAILLQHKNTIYKNLSLIISVLLILSSINQDIYAQKVWELGKTAELKLSERIINRIEEKATNFPLIPVFSSDISLRPRYYKDSYTKKSPYVLNQSFMIRHIPSGIYNFYSPYTLFKTNSQIETLTPEIYDFIINATTPYPATNSIYIDNKYAIIMLTKEGISAFKAQLPK